MGIKISDFPERLVSDGTEWLPVVADSQNFKLNVTKVMVKGQIEPLPNTLAERSSLGTVKTATPTVHDDAANKSYVDRLGYVGSFSNNFVVGSSDHFAVWPISAGGDGKFYRWDGALPKIVSSSYTPTTDGFGVGKWVNIMEDTNSIDLGNI